jgi:DNA-binding transcriptional MerR regulator
MEPACRETKPASNELMELQQPEVQEEFEKLQTLVRDTIEPVGKLRILRAAQHHGFSLPQLRWAFQEHRGGLNKAGGLISFAEHWDEYTAGTTVPACGKCFDHGVLEPQWFGFGDRQEFCDCEAGQTKAQSAFERQERRQAESQIRTIERQEQRQPEVCAICKGLGHWDGQSCQCPLGRARSRLPEEVQVYLQSLPANAQALYLKSVLEKRTLQVVDSWPG